MAKIGEFLGGKKGKVLLGAIGAIGGLTIASAIAGKNKEIDCIETEFETESNWLDQEKDSPFKEEDSEEDE